MNVDQSVGCIKLSSSSFFYDQMKLSS